MALIFIFTTLLFNSCKKESSENQLDVNKEIIDKVTAWLEKQKASTTPERAILIQSFTDNLEFSGLRFEDLYNGEKFIIVPLNKNFKSHFNKDKNPSNTAVFILTKSGNIRKGNIVQYVPNSGKTNVPVPQNSFFKIYNFKHLDEDGTFTFLNIIDKPLYEFKYKNGKLHTHSVATKRSPPTEASTMADKTQTMEGGCIDWYWVTTYPDGSQTSEYLYRSCYGEGDSIYGGSGVGGGEPINVDGVDNICSKSFSFSKKIETSDGIGGWQVAGVRNIHMNIIDFTTSNMKRLVLPDIYFGLPVIKANGDFYSTSTAAGIASDAVEYAEQKVMEYYHSIGGSLDLVGMNLYYRNKINEYMQNRGGSASLSPGSNITNIPITDAIYSGILGLNCL